MQSTSLIIKNLCPGLAEVGKIKVGEKGRTITSQRGTTFQPPQKLDHFKVTTLYRGPDGNYELDREVHKKYGEKPRTIPVRLLFDEIDLNFQCRYACFQGRSLWCSGDGETASRANGGDGSRQDVPCPCGRQAPEYTGQDKCKINSRLSVLIDGTERVGGVWVLRSTSYNTTVGILSSLALIKRITGGPLAGLPLELTLNPKTAVTPDGKLMNIWVVGIEFKGSIQALQQIGLDQAKRDALHHARIERIEQDARLLLAHDPLALKEEADDMVEEFYPDQAASGIKPQSPPEPPLEAETTAPTEEVVSPAIPQPPPSGNGAPVAQQPTEPVQQPEHGTRRRARKFDVDPNEWNGQSQLSTCGVTPDQIRAIQAYAKDPNTKRIIQDYLKLNTGYEQLSFLRFEEAESLIANVIGALPSDNTQQQDPPVELNDLIECPNNPGDRVSVSQFCHRACLTREREGWCPICGDDPPDAGGLL